MVRVPNIRLLGQTRSSILNLIKVIVNIDGTLARISNWHEMNELEQNVNAV
jgi:hypothetical protein